MTAQPVETKDRYEIPFNASTTNARVIYFPEFPELPGRYVDDLRASAEPAEIDLEVEFAVYSDEATEWAEMTLQTPDRWPAV